MIHKLIVCPYCHGNHGVKRGKTDTGKQRYRCPNSECAHHSFLLDPAYKGRSPEVKQQIVEMSLNGSGIRGTARGVQIRTTTVIQEVKIKALSSQRSIPHS